MIRVSIVPFSASEMVHLPSLTPPALATTTPPMSSMPPSQSQRTSGSSRFRLFHTHSASQNVSTRSSFKSHVHSPELVPAASCAGVLLVEVVDSGAGAHIAGMFKRLRRFKELRPCVVQGCRLLIRKPSSTRVRYHPTSRNASPRNAVALVFRFPAKSSSVWGAT